MSAVRAVAYIRPNALADAGTQQSDIVRYAALAGIRPTNIETLVEERVGHVWRSMLVDVRAGRCSVVVVWSLSSLGGTTFAILRMVGVLLRSGARLLSSEERVDIEPKSATARFVEAILRLERIEAAGRRRMGEAHGRPPRRDATGEQAVNALAQAGSERGASAILGVSRSVLRRALDDARIEGEEPDVSVIDAGFRRVRRTRP